MRIQDLSIRRKLLLSNMMMILIPVVLILVIVGGAVLGLFAAMVPENQAVLLFKLGGSVSNYQLQLVFDSMCEKLSGKDEKDKSQIATLVESLEAYGAAVSVSGGPEAYQTPNTTLESMLIEAKAITGMEGLEDTPLFIRNDKGLVYNMPVTNQNNKRVRLLVVSPELTLAENAYSIWDSWDSIKAMIKLGAVLVAGVAVIIVVITGILLAGKLFKTIIVPLKSIQRSTREIQDGNLDCPVEVSGRDELGEVCEDFEDMRLRLKESVELEQKYENSRKELIAGISHDLSTPLTAIKGYTSGLLEGVANTPQKKAHYLQTIYDTACDMEGLVDSLFLFSKLDTGKIVFDLETVHAAPWVMDFMKEAANRPKDKKITLTLYNEVNPKTEIQIDQIQFGRVLNNLLENSLKYGTEESLEMTVYLKENPQHFILRLQDNGPGVSAEELPKLFDSFYRTDPARSGAKKGSGLGLAISREIIETLGGTIWAEQATPKGLTLVICLPIREEKP